MAKRRIPLIAAGNVPPEQRRATEVLQQAMGTMVGMAERPVGTKGRSPQNVMAQHLERVKWLEKGAAIAEKLAPYQSPRLAAVAVADGESGAEILRMAVSDETEARIKALLPGSTPPLVIEGEAVETKTPEALVASGVVSICIWCGDPGCSNPDCDG